MRDNLQVKPPGERMAQIKTMISRYPLPRESHPYWMQFAEVTGKLPFELAATFKIWQELNRLQRREIESLPGAPERRSRLIEYARDLKLFREFRPAISMSTTGFPRSRRRSPTSAPTIPSRRTPSPRQNLHPSARMRARSQPRGSVSPLTRRLAINLYFLEQPTRAQSIRSASPSSFAAMPPWSRRFEFLHRRRGRAPLDSGLPAALPQGRVQASRPWDVCVDCAWLPPKPAPAPATRTGCIKKKSQPPRSASSAHFATLDRPRNCLQDSPGMSTSDLAWMNLALAEGGTGEEGPSSPIHGRAILVLAGRVVGLGHHARFGGPHAEVMALQNAAEARVQPSTCTLEPCCHHGKTPPCTDAILQAGVAKVVAAIRGPFPAWTVAAWRSSVRPGFRFISGFRLARRPRSMRLT